MDSVTIGVLGGGQLAMMMGTAAASLGITLKVLDPNPTCPASYTASVVEGDYTDLPTLLAFAEQVDRITFEFENVNTQVLSRLSASVPLLPGLAALSMAQDRSQEKAFFVEHGVPCADYRVAKDQAALEAAVQALSGDVIVKTCRDGYDGKGQASVQPGDDVHSLFARLGGVPLIVEKRIRFDRELSLIAARDEQGRVVCYPLTENQHHEGILRRSQPVDEPHWQRAAEQMTIPLLETLDYIGVMTVEYFFCEGQWIANEIAPRVHNSGHWTIEGAHTSQFEQHLRAVAGMPLGDPRVKGFPVMRNCIGTWPDPQRWAEAPTVYCHDYHKTPRSGRKLGHVTYVAPTETLASTFSLSDKERECL